MYGIVIAFKNYKFRLGVFGSPWIGFENFRTMFRGVDFFNVFRNTLIISFYKLIFTFPAPIILALLLNEVRNRAYKKTIQTISYLPHFLSWVILAGVFMQLLSPSQGPINYIIKSLGGKAIYFLGDPKWFRTTLVATSVWKGIGWGSIIYIASISSINPELYEAAYIDGANRFVQTIKITLPSIVPVITIMFILSTGSLINDDFDQIFNLYNPAVYDVADVISTYTYRMGLVQMQYSFSTAVGLFKNIISFLLIMITNYITSRFSEYGIW
ncbi:MAG: sugar ABC transporter permease [Firmicutes bacterium]|nr:sugar ABC transporter permease [Bacillota bacterium]